MSPDLAANDSLHTFRYAVVEDEPTASTLLKKVLTRLAPEARLEWEASDGKAAFQCLLNQPVDVLFLDVEFPPGGAFELLADARNAGVHLPKIVFVTSHNEHALKAFEWAACDYLLKPISKLRVGETLQRLKAALPSPNLGALLDAMRHLAPKRPPERFTVSIRDRVLVLRWSEVMYLHTEFRQVYAQTSRGRIPIDQPMDELEAALSPQFLRIHRSTLINLDHLQEVHNPPARAGQAIMQNGAALNVSRARMDVLLKRLALLGSN